MGELGFWVNLKKKKERLIQSRWVIYTPATLKCLRFGFSSKISLSLNKTSDTQG